MKTSASMYIIESSDIYKGENIPVMHISKSSWNLNDKQKWPTIYSKLQTLIWLETKHKH